MDEDIEGYGNSLELAPFREYRDAIGLFRYVVETERCFYLRSQVDVQARPAGGDVYLELKLTDAWVWDIYRSSHFVRSVHVVTFKDVNAEELSKPELSIPWDAHSSRESKGKEARSLKEARALFLIRTPSGSPPRPQAMMLRLALIVSMGKSGDGGGGMNTLTLPEKNEAKRGMRDHRCILGKAGEETVAKTLSEAGLVIRGRNWRAGRIGELDLVAHEGEKTIIIEVRTRIGQRPNTSLELVDRRKIVRSRRLAGQWSGQNRLRQPICIDVIALGLPPQARECLLHIKEDMDLHTLGAEAT